MSTVLLVIAGLVRQEELAGDASGGQSPSREGFRAPTTSEIAWRMQAYLQERGCTVDVVSAETRKVELSRYDLVVVGSGVYGMRPHPSAVAFVKSHQDALAATRTAFFAVCGLVCSESEKHRRAAQRFADPMVNGLTPVAKAVFAGRVKAMGRFAELIGKLLFKSPPPGDYRDWDAIRDWTRSLRADDPPHLFRR